MYDFTRAQRHALATMPSPAARFAVERWVELTYEDTHPYWRCRPNELKLSDGAARLETAIRGGNLDEVAGCIAQVSGGLLAQGFSRDWQYNAVKSYIIDASSKFATEDFFDRLRTLASGQSTRAAEVGGPVTLEWRITEQLPAGVKLPWREPSVTLGRQERHKREYTITERGKAQEREWVVSTAVDDDLTRHITSAAASITSDASILLDLVRVTYGEPGAFQSHRIEVKGSSRMTYVRSRPVPRVRTRARARAAVGRVLKIIAKDPSSELARRLTGAVGWFSTFVVRWPENPRFATAMLWMALEALFGQHCVIQHKNRCRHRRQLTAVDVFASDLSSSLANELEDYLLHMRGTESDWKKGIRNPPEWCRGWISRGTQAPREWAAGFLEGIPDSDQSEPLFKWHCEELVRFDATGEAAARGDAERNLRRLERMRNAAAHEGDPLLGDEEADFLGAFAGEILFMAFDDPESLCIEPRPA